MCVKKFSSVHIVTSCPLLISACVPDEPNSSWRKSTPRVTPWVMQRLPKPLNPKPRQCCLSVLAIRWKFFRSTDALRKYPPVPSFRLVLILICPSCLVSVFVVVIVIIVVVIVIFVVVIVIIVVVIVIITVAVVLLLFLLLQWRR